MLTLIFSDATYPVEQMGKTIYTGPWPTVKDFSRGECCPYVNSGIAKPERGAP